MAQIRQATTKKALSSDAQKCFIKAPLIAKYIKILKYVKTAKYFQTFKCFQANNEYPLAQLLSTNQINFLLKLQSQQ